MKSKIKYGLIVFFTAVLFVCTILASINLSHINVYADEGNITCETVSGKYLDDAYVSVYKVPTSMFTYESNGGAAGGKPLSNAFDGNWNSFWSTGRQNSNTFFNSITVTFKKPVTIDAILYASSSERTGHGYPNILNIYAANEGEEFSLYGTCTSTPTNNRVVFKLKESITVTKIKFEYRKILWHNWITTAKEIQFLQPDNESANTVLNLFDDYTQYVVKEQYKRNLDQLREDVKDLISYESALKPILDRADAVVAGILTKDVHREFQTSPNARNPINQYGDMGNYARNELLLNSIGTNRQVIGIGGATGEEIVIYVEAEEGDPLPQIAFTQIYGAWNSWMSTATLKRGKNVFTFPNFVYPDKYSVPIQPGGPIHIINPYTPEQQSSNVKIYFEGGYIYPVFHDGDDETTFKMILDDYYARLQDPNDTSVTIDAFEAVSDSIILSCRASTAYQAYHRNNFSPQLNIDRWTNYVLNLLSFGGVDCKPGGTYYDVRNEHITINYRAVQPFAGFYAFAAGEHIGIPDSNSHIALAQKTSTGWAMAHEFGHTVDLRGRIWGEVTNNMWAIYDRYMMEGLFDDRVNLGQVCGRLASDFSGSINNLWNSGHYNSSFWFMIEGGYPGYWAGSENAYRYELARETNEENKTLIKQLGNTEKMIYFGSIGAKDDLRDYFDRWGFFMNGDGTFNANNRWAKSKQSAALNTLIQRAKESGKIKGDGKKYWYIDIDQYRYLKEHNEKLDGWASCYNEDQVINIDRVVSVGKTYTLLLPTPKNQEAHLGYEIQSKINGEWKVLGFTYESSYTDTYNYNGAMPTYRVVAYDRALNHSGVSQEKTATPDTSESVCRIGDTYYNTLKEAVDASRNGDIIILMKSCYAGGISFNDKKIIICPDGDVTEDLVITKSSSGPIFNNVTSEAYNWDTSLQIGNNSGNGARIVLDGNNFDQSGALIFVRCDLNLNNVLLRNNKNSGNGGGVYVGMEATVRLKKVVIENNSAANGGGVYIDGRSRLHLNGVTIRNNTASGKGGGIFMTENLGPSTLTNANNKNSANFITGNTAQYGGGIYVENSVNLFNVEISENKATVQGGGIYANIPYERGNIGMTTCKMQNNTAPIGGTFYMNRGKVYLNGGVYNGNFYKVLSGNNLPEFYLNMSLPDFGGAEFELANIAEDGTILINDITNFTMTAEQAQGLNIKNGHGVLTETKVVAHRNILKIKANYNGGTFEFERPMGKFTLPECVPEFDKTKYITTWTIGGKKYNTGDVIDLLVGITVQAEVKKYCVVTMNYGTSTETKYFKPNDVYYMPMKTPEGEVVLGFRCSNGEYYVYADGATITEDLVFEVDTKKFLNVTWIVEGKSSISSCEYDKLLVLNAPAEVSEGKYFKHWLINDKEYAANAKFRVTENFTATAVLGDTYQVNITVDGETETLKYQYNTLVNLGVPEKTIEGKMFKHWLIDEVAYLAGTTYQVKGEVTIVAVYEDLPAATGSNKVSVILQSVKNDAEVTQEEMVDLSTNYTLPIPEVDEDQVFLGWTINGVKYGAGESVYITQGMTAVAEIAAKNAAQDTEINYVVKNITMDDNQEREISRYRMVAHYGEEMTLSTMDLAPEGYKLSHYIVDSTRKNLGEKVKIYPTTDVKAVYVVGVDYTLKNVMFKKGLEREISKSYLFAAVGETIVLAEPAQIPDRCKFDYYVVNGERKNIGDSIVISASDIDIKAVYLMEIDYAVRNVVVENEKQKEVSRSQATIYMGTALVLATPTQVPAGCKFEYYMVNGEKKNLGDSVEIYPDTEIQAMYSVLPKVEDTEKPGENQPGDNTPGGDSGDEKNPKSKTTTIVIVVVCVLVVLLAAGGVVTFFLLKKKKQENGTEDPAPKAKKSSAKKKVAPAEEAAPVKKEVATEVKKEPIKKAVAPVEKAAPVKKEVVAEAKKEPIKKAVAPVEKAAPVKKEVVTEVKKEPMKKAVAPVEKAASVKKEVVTEVKKAPAKKTIAPAEEAANVKAKKVAPPKAKTATADSKPKPPIRKAKDSEK